MEQEEEAATTTTATATATTGAGEEAPAPVETAESNTELDALKNMGSDDEEDEKRSKLRIKKKKKAQQQPPVSPPAAHAGNGSSAGGGGGSKHRDEAGLKKKKKKTKKKKRQDDDDDAGLADDDDDDIDEDDEKIGDSDNEVIHGTAERATSKTKPKSDEDFIADEEDLPDLREEYENEEQNYKSDEDPNEAPKQKKQKKSANETTSSSRNYPKGKADQILDEILEKRKKKKPLAGLSDEQKAELAKKTVDKMKEAAKKDRECLAKREPAFQKLKILPEIMSSVSTPDLWEELKKAGLVEQITSWLTPYKNTIMTNVEIRTKLIELLSRMKLDLGDIENTGLSNLAVRLSTHNEETRENRKILQLLVSGWKSAFLKTSGETDELPRNIEPLDEDTDLKDSKQMRPPRHSVRSNNRPTNRAEISLQSKLAPNKNQKKAVATESESSYYLNHAKTPQQIAFDFKVNVEKSKELRENPNQRAQGDENSDIIRRLDKIGATKKKRNSTGLSVEGRGV